MEQLSRTVVAYRYSPTQIHEVSAKNDIKDQDKSLEKKLKLIYSDVGKNKEEDKKLEYVIKILEGGKII